MQVRVLIGAVVGAVLAAAACSQGDLGIEVDGTYHMRSSFQTAHGIPEREAPELVAFVELASQPDRVEEWLLDRLGDELGQPYKSLLDAARGEADADEELRKYLSLVAPGYKRSLVELAEEIAKATASLNLHSELTLQADGVGRTGTATHRLSGVWLELGTQEVRIDFGDVGIADGVVSTTEFTLDDETDNDELLISFAEQYADVPYGRLLNLIVNDILVERRDPFADSLAEYLSSTVPCNGIGQLLTALVDDVNVPPEVYGTACAVAFGELGRAILPGHLQAMTLGLSFEGDALLVEGEDSDLVGGFAKGEWEGWLTYPSTSFTLRRPSHVFAADRSTARDDVIAQ